MICSYLIFPLSFIVIMLFFVEKVDLFLFVGCFVCLRLKCRNTQLFYENTALV